MNTPSLHLEPVICTPKSKKIEKQYDALVGLQSQKEELLTALRLILNPREFNDWIKKHKHTESTFLNNWSKVSPMILLSGDVGCGKSELANSCGAALAKEMGQKVEVYSTPSDLRGSGRVGGISLRITAVFNQILNRENDTPAILILDEADDIASSREHSQQHHEDRAGVNALIKELDRLERSTQKVAVLFITNRPGAMDPAILRRASSDIQFYRPDENALKEVLYQITEGSSITEEQQKELLAACLDKAPGFTYSDIYRKVVRKAILQCWKNDTPFHFNALLLAIQQTKASPKFTEI